MTIRIPGTIVFDMAIHGGPLPTRAEIPKDRDAAMMITCTEDQALAIESWLRIAGRQRRNHGETELYLKCAASIAQARGGGA